jgi:group II intron reverse transcriptase/maturase
MSLDKAMRQKSTQMELPLVDRGAAPGERRSGEAVSAANGNDGSGTDHLMELVVEHGNLKRALKRVKANKGSPGIDGMTVEELPVYLQANWEWLRAQLLDGLYQPQAVRQQEIPKASGGVRKLGIPTVVDRVIQQAILQVLGPRFDSTFSDHSYGFRPGRRAHDAVCSAQRYIQEGRHWVVDVDLEQFFDRVNHDVLMGKLAKRIADRRLLGLVRRFLEAGILANGIAMERHEGTPQGGPLSPLLANVLLDEVDKELEKRGHAFVRYADDSNVYVRSERAGERVMQALRRLFADLRLRVNEAKSAVARPWDRKFLGYTFWVSKDAAIRRRIADKTLETMKERVRQITSRTRGRSLASVIADLRGYLPGWKEYFRLTEMPGVLRNLDAWIRSRLRMVQLKQWKTGPCVFRELCARGVPRNAAASAAAHAQRWWRIAHHPALNLAMPPREFDRLGLPRLAP